MLDKAYLSDDENLAILISAADKLFDEKKITLEQFTNVILMLRYAYELRKLPNEKDGKLNMHIKPIVLNVKSYDVIQKICRELNKKLNDLSNSNNFKTIIDELQNVVNERQVLNNENIKSADNVINTSNLDPALETQIISSTKDNANLQLLMKSLKVYEQLINQLKKLNDEYKNKLLELIESTKNASLIAKADNRIKKMDTSNKNLMNVVEKVGWLLYSLTTEDTLSIKSMEVEINKIIIKINNFDKVMSSPKFREVKKYYELYQLAQYSQENIVEDSKLNRWQIFVNWLLSILHINNEYYKISASLNFNNQDSIFNKYIDIDMIEEDNAAYEDAIKEELYY